MKSKFIFLSVLLISLLMLGCGQKKASDEVTIWVQASLDTPEGKMFADRVEEYNKQNPDKKNVVIKSFTRAGAGSGYIDRLNAAITAGDMPDIFTLDGPDVASYATNKVIAPVDEYLSPEFLDGFTDAMKEQGIVDGKTYALGYSDSGVIVMYHEDIINLLEPELKALIPTDTDTDWTWEDFYKVAKGLKDLKSNSKTKDLDIVKNMEVPVSFLLTDVPKGAYEIAIYYLAPMIWSNGSNVVSENGLEVEGYLNNPKTIESLSLLGKFFEENLANASEPDKAFYTKKSPMALAGFWYVSEFEHNYPDVEYRSVRYPKFDKEYKGNFTPSGSWAFVMRNGLEKEKAEEVAKVLKWMTNSDASKQYYEKNGSIPTRTDAVSVINTETNSESYNEAWKALKYQVKNRNKARPVSPGYPYLSETFAKDIILKIAQTKTSDKNEIKQYADDAIEKINREFEKYRR